jgi:hypothetical protein
MVALSPQEKKRADLCDNTKSTLDHQPSDERMKIMVTDTSATMRHEAPHVNHTTRTATIVKALERRAQAVLNDTSIDPQSRAIIRYALETNDPWLAELVRRADAGETIFDTVDFSQTPDTSEHHSSDEKIEALAEMICRAGDEPETKISRTACADVDTGKLHASEGGELNLFGMVEAQVATVEGELFAGVV